MTMPDLTAHATLRESLETFTVEHLKPRAALCTTARPTRKGELIEVIVSTLHSPEGLKKLWARMNPLSHQVIAAALENGNQLDEDGFRVHHGQLPWDALQRKNVWGYSARRAEYLPVELMFYAGRIPPDLAALLKPLAPRAEKFVINAVMTLPAEEAEDLLIAETEAAALHDLAATLSLIAEGKATLTPKTGRPAASGLTKLSERLLHGEFLPPDEDDASPEPIRAYGWLVLVQAAKLARAAGAKLELTPKGQKVLAQPTSAHLQDIFENWCHANQFDELTRIRALKGFQKAKGWLTRPAERKTKLLAALAQCPAGMWIEREAFLRAVRAWGCNFQIETHPYGNKLYVGSSWEYGYLAGFGASAQWRATQAQYLLACLFEYLAPLGALDIAYEYPENADFKIEDLDHLSDTEYFSAYVGLRYFRITPLGAYLLGLTSAYAGPARPALQPVFTVMPNHEIAITHREQFTPNVRTLLERLTEPVSEGVYRLEREQILTALETGLTRTAITDFLTEKSAHPLPQTVCVFLDDLERNSRALKEGGAAVLFEAQDAPLAQLIANDSVLRKFCTVTGTATLVVPTNKEAAFRRRLKQLGFGIRR